LLRLKKHLPSQPIAWDVPSIGNFEILVPQVLFESFIEILALLVGKPCLSTEHRSSLPASDYLSSLANLNKELGVDATA